jgi:hypothetical protein
MGGGQPDASAAPGAPAGGPSIMAGQGSQPGFMGGNANLMPPPAQGAAPSAQGGSMGGLPFSIGFPELAFNGGKNLGDLAMKYNTPTSLRSGGYASYQDGRLLQLPQAPAGYQSVSNGDGSFKFVPVSGGTDAVASASAAQASGKAGFDQVELVDPVTHIPYKAFKKDLPGFGGPSSAPPATPSSPAGPSRATAAQPGDSDYAPILTAAYQDAQTRAAGKGPQGADPDAMRRGQTDMAAIQQEARAKRVPLGGPTGLPSNAMQSGTAPGTAEAAKSGVEMASSSYKNVMQAAQPAATVQARLDDIEKFSKTAILGGDTQWRDFANNLLSIAGVSDKATDRKTAGDLIEKNASQIALAIGSGSQGTDALRSLAAAANPGRKMTQDAISQAVAQLKASAQVAQAKAQLLTPKYNAITSNPAAAGDYNTSEQQFDKNADYRVFQMVNDTKGMNSDQIKSYFQAKGYSPAQVQTLIGQKNALKGLGVQF